MNAASGTFKLTESECIVQLQRTCVASLDDAALSGVVANFCCNSDLKAEDALIFALTCSILAPRVSDLKSPASRQLFATITSVVKKCLSCVANQILWCDELQVKVNTSAFFKLAFLLMKGSMGGPQCETLTRCIKEALTPTSAVDFIT